MRAVVYTNRNVPDVIGIPHCENWEERWLVIAPAGNRINKGMREVHEALPSAEEMMAAVGEKAHCLQ